MQNTVVVSRKYFSASGGHNITHHLFISFLRLSSRVVHEHVRRRERHKIKCLMSKTMALNARYKSLYISLPSSAKQQREVTKARPHVSGYF